MKRRFGFVIAMSMATGVLVTVTRHHAVVPVLKASTVLSPAAGGQDDCSGSARVTYDDYDSRNGDIILNFVGSETQHTENDRAIVFYYKVNYSCFQKQYTEGGQVGSLTLDKGETSKSKEEEYIPEDCALPDSTRRINGVDITRISCH